QAQRHRRDPARAQAHELEDTVRHHGTSAQFEQRPLGIVAADSTLVKRALAGERNTELDLLDHFTWPERVIRAPVARVAKQVPDREAAAPVGDALRFVS